MAVAIISDPINYFSLIYARSYFERALVLLDDWLKKYRYCFCCISATSSSLDTIVRIFMIASNSQKLGQQERIIPSNCIC